jgi:iron complex outermembrane recepter protein
MHSFIRMAPLASISAISLALPAHAQQAAAPAPTAIADDGTAEETGDLIVTARRRSEGVQDVPIAISVVDGTQIDDTGSFNVGRLQQLTPTLQFYSSNPRNTSVNIRGLGSPFGLTNDGIDQGVGIYVDDVYYSRVASSTFDFLDIDRIEVLRGPQGTLYGKNTTAGAINITTRQPTFDFEARAEASIGNLDFRQLKAAVSGPLSETIAARLAISSTGRRGTIFNTTTDRIISARGRRSCFARAKRSTSPSPPISTASVPNAARKSLCAPVRPSARSIANMPH